MRTGSTWGTAPQDHVLTIQATNKTNNGINRNEIIGSGGRQESELSCRPVADMNEDYSSPLPFEPWVTVSHHRDQALQTAKQSLVFECTCRLQESELSDVALAKAT